MNDYTYICVCKTLYGTYAHVFDSGNPVAKLQMTIPAVISCCKIRTITGEEYCNPALLQLKETSTLKLSVMLFHC